MGLEEPTSRPLENLPSMLSMTWLLSTIAGGRSCPVLVQLLAAWLYIYIFLEYSVLLLVACIYIYILRIFGLRLRIENFLHVVQVRAMVYICHVVAHGQFVGGSLKEQFIGAHWHDWRTNWD